MYRANIIPADALVGKAEMTTRLLTSWTLLQNVKIFHSVFCTNSDTIMKNIEIYYHLLCQYNACTTLCTCLSWIIVSSSGLMSNISSFSRFTELWYWFENQVHILDKVTKYQVLIWLNRELYPKYLALDRKYFYKIST